MARLKANLKDQVSSSARGVYKDTSWTNEVGFVRSVADGIVKVSGVRRVAAGELLRVWVQSGDFVIALALNLERDEVGGVVLGRDYEVRQGDLVTTTDSLMTIEVGTSVQGRVIDPLGRFLDGAGTPSVPGQRSPLETNAPGILARRSVFQPLHTGIKVVDSLTPVGRGQRELIIGDRQVGKTTLAVDTIIRQGQEHLEGGVDPVYCLRFNWTKKIYSSTNCSRITSSWVYGVYHRGSSYCFGTGFSTVFSSLRGGGRSGVVP